MAYNAAYQGACSILSRLGENLENNEDNWVPVLPLRQASDLLMQAIAADDSRVEPYVLLAGIFLCLNKRPLVDKYIILAEQRDPNFSELRRLKEHLITPMTLRKGSNKSPAGPKIDAASIQRVQRFAQSENTASNTSNNSFKRFFAPILPLLASPEDLQHWVQASCQHSLGEEEAQQLYHLIIGQAPGSTREQMLQLKNLLQTIRPEFGQRPSLFAQELSRSGPGVLRQIYLLLRPFDKKFPTVQSLQKALEQQFQITLDPAQLEPLFQLMHWHELNWNQLDAPQESLVQLKAILEQLLPEKGEDMDLSLLLEQLQTYSPAMA